MSYRLLKVMAAAILLLLLAAVTVPAQGTELVLLTGILRLGALVILLVLIINVLERSSVLATGGDGAKPWARPHLGLLGLLLIALATDWYVALTDYSPQRVLVVAAALLFCNIGLIGWMLLQWRGNR
mgnify:CR=1 FL=1